MDLFPFFNSFWWNVNKDNILHIIDATIYLLFLVSVLYLLFFSIMSVTKWNLRYDTAKRKHKFIILFLAHSKDDENIINAVLDLQNQDYPIDKYDILIGHDGLTEHTIEQLQEVGVETYAVTNSYDCGSSLKELLAVLPERAYEIAILLDANNMLSDHYLTRLNEAYYSGCMAVQTHRVPMETPSILGRFSSYSEEINNSIFRKGHVQLGFSSALNSSGIALDYDWIKEYSAFLKKNDIVKQLETDLLKQNIYIDYMNDVYTFLTKSNASGKKFQKQHQKWQREKYISIFRELPRFPIFFFRGNWDYCNKIIQWAIPSRIILTLLIILFACVTFLYDWTTSIKWFVLLIVLFIAYAIAAPEKLINKNNYKNK